MSTLHSRDQDQDELPDTESFEMALDHTDALSHYFTDVCVKKYVSDAHVSAQSSSHIAEILTDASVLPKLAQRITRGTKSDVADFIESNFKALPWGLRTHIIHDIRSLHLTCNYSMTTANTLDPAEALVGCHRSFSASSSSTSSSHPHFSSDSSTFSSSSSAPVSTPGSSLSSSTPFSLGHQTKLMNDDTFLDSSQYPTVACLFTSWRTGVITSSELLKRLYSCVESGQIQQHLADRMINLTLKEGGHGQLESLNEFYQRSGRFRVVLRDVDLVNTAVRTCQRPMPGLGLCTGQTGSLSDHSTDAGVELITSDKGVTRVLLQEGRVSGYTTSSSSLSCFYGGGLTWQHSGDGDILQFVVNNTSVRPLAAVTGDEAAALARSGGGGVGLGGQGGIGGGVGGGIGGGVGGAEVSPTLVIGEAIAFPGGTIDVDTVIGVDVLETSHDRDVDAANRRYSICILVDGKVSAGGCLDYSSRGVYDGCSEVEPAEEDVDDGATSGSGGDDLQKIPKRTPSSHSALKHRFYVVFVTAHRGVAQVVAVASLQHALALDQKPTSVLCMTCSHVAVAGTCGLLGYFELPVVGKETTFLHPEISAISRLNRIYSDSVYVPLSWDCEKGRYEQECDANSTATTTATMTTTSVSSAALSTNGTTTGSGTAPACMDTDESSAVVESERAYQRGSHSVIATITAMSFQEGDTNVLATGDSEGVLCLWRIQPRVGRDSKCTINSDEVQSRQEYTSRLVCRSQLASGQASEPVSVAPNSTPAGAMSCCSSAVDGTRTRTRDFSTGRPANSSSGGSSDGHRSSTTSSSIFRDSDIPSLSSFSSPSSLDGSRSRGHRIHSLAVAASGRHITVAFWDRLLLVSLSNQSPRNPVSTATTATTATATASSLFVRGTIDIVEGFRAIYTVCFQPEAIRVWRAMASIRPLPSPTSSTSTSTPTSTSTSALGPLRVNTEVSLPEYATDVVLTSWMHQNMDCFDLRFGIPGNDLQHFEMLPGSTSTSTSTSNTSANLTGTVLSSAQPLPHPLVSARLQDDSAGCGTGRPPLPVRMKPKVLPPITGTVGLKRSQMSDSSNSSSSSSGNSSGSSSGSGCSNGSRRIPQLHHQSDPTVILMSVTASSTLGSHTTVMSAPHNSSSSSSSSSTSAHGSADGELASPMRFGPVSAPFAGASHWPHAGIHASTEIEFIRTLRRLCQHEGSPIFSEAAGILCVYCSAFQSPAIGLIAAALETEEAAVWQSFQTNPLLQMLLRVTAPPPTTPQTPSTAGANPAPTAATTLASSLVEPRDVGTRRLLKWLSSTESRRVGQEFWLEVSVGHNHLCALYLKFCGNKSVAVEHTWHQYLNNHGCAHFRKASRGLRRLTTTVRKIDETANIRGSLPRQMGFVTGLQEVYARRVGLTGRLPAELGELSQLRVLSMGNNQLCGELPASLGNLCNLQRIVLHQNRLTGIVPESLGKLGCIVNLAGNPGLTHGPDVPKSERQTLMEIFHSTRGTAWNIKSHWCSEDQPVSKWYKVGVLASHVHSIVMSSNGMDGRLPASIGNLDRLRMIELATMPDLKGPLPKQLCSITSLRRLCICRCALTGPIPEEIGELTRLEELQLFGNNFTGALPHGLRHLVNLKLLSLGEYTGGNDFTSGPLPVCLSYLLNLEALFLANCNIKGNLPDWIGNLRELRQLDLQHNSITGTIPPAIGTLTNLLYLNLKDNTHLGGALPVGPLSNLTKLNRLSLVHCSFDLGPNSSAVNSLQGILPRCKIWA